MTFSATGCASKRSTSAKKKETPSVTATPQTGSHIPVRVLKKSDSPSEGAAKKTAKAKSKKKKPEIIVVRGGFR